MPFPNFYFLKVSFSCIGAVDLASGPLSVSFTIFNLELVIESASINCEYAYFSSSVSSTCGTLWSDFIATNVAGRGVCRFGTLYNVTIGTVS